MVKGRMNRLLVEIAKGNNKAFEELYYETSKGIYALLFSYLKDYNDTEDVLQDVFIIVKQKAHLYKKDTDARAWLFQIAKNQALNALRSKKREKERLDIIEQDMLSFKSDYKKDSTLFLIMQQVLSEEEYQIVIKHVLFSYKHKDIAKELNLPLGTVLSKYQIALSKLRKELE